MTLPLSVEAFDGLVRDAVNEPDLQARYDKGFKVCAAYAALLDDARLCAQYIRAASDLTDIHGQGGYEMWTPGDLASSGVRAEVGHAPECSCWYDNFPGDCGATEYNRHLHQDGMKVLKKLRDETTEEGRQIWADVDKAAERAPLWFKEARALRDAFVGEFPQYAGEFDMPEAVAVYRRWKR